MYVFHSQMHLFTLVFLLLELMLFTFQLWYYYSWPADKSRLWYLVLIALLIFYNVTGGLFPDPNIDFISIRLQNIIAFGSGFLVASYLPFYFYISFSLTKLKFHALYGVPLFLIFPYIIFFVLHYSLYDDLNQTIKYGMVIPFFYSIVILFALSKAICIESGPDNNAASNKKKSEMRLVYCATTPWSCLALVTYFQMEQWIEVLLTNSGFVLVTILFMIRHGKHVRVNTKNQLLEIERSKGDFYNKCKIYSLTKRESEIAELLCQGMTYKQIGEYLFISEKTVDSHVQHIFPKTGANKVIELLQKLG